MIVAKKTLYNGAIEFNVIYTQILIVTQEKKKVVKKNFQQ